MQILVESWPELAALAGLLVLSAFFSGSETALFSLQPDEVRELGRTGGRSGRAVRTLRRDPRGLLVCVLFGNMTVNLLYFCSSAVIAMRFAETGGHRALVVSSAVSLLAVIIIGEVTPKAIAVSRPEAFAALAGLPVLLAYRLTMPIRRLVGVIARAAEGRRPRPAGLTQEELVTMVDVAERSGVLGRDERKMMEDVLELGLVRLREIMTPRVDIIACDVTTPPAEALELAREHTFANIPVYEGKIDAIVGVVNARDIFFAGDDLEDLRSIAGEPHFVPEQKDAESTLREFLSTGSGFAIVVDEYGGVAGLVTLEDLVEEIVGEIADEFDAASRTPVEMVDPNEYLLDGALSVRDWADLFEAEFIDEEDEFANLDTVGGLVMYLLGRIPKTGDEVSYQNVRFRVEEMSRRRVRRVRLSLVDAGGGGGGGGAPATRGTKEMGKEAGS